MRAVIQRVRRASVTVDGTVLSSIKEGLLIFVGIEDDDTEQDMNYMINKTLGLRLFNDAQGRMNLSAEELGKELLIVSQFTLYGDTRKGRRPSYNRSAAPDSARSSFRKLEALYQQAYSKCSFGEFQAHMDVELVNDGPVTLLVDSKKEF